MCFLKIQLTAQLGEKIEAFSEKHLNDIFLAWLNQQFMQMKTGSYEPMVLYSWG